MKRFKKIFIVLVIGFMFTLITYPSVKAQESVPNEEAEVIDELEPSDLGKRFKEEIVPLLINFFVSLGGTSVGLFIVDRIFKKVIDKLTKSQENIEKANTRVQESEKINQAIKLTIESTFEKVLADIENIKNDLVEKNERDEERRIKQVKTNEQILEVLRIAFLNNPELVRTGHATEIAKVVGNGKEKEKTKEATII